MNISSFFSGLEKTIESKTQKQDLICIQFAGKLKRRMSSICKTPDKALRGDKISPAIEGNDNTVIESGAPNYDRLVEQAAAMKAMVTMFLRLKMYLSTYSRWPIKDFGLYQ